MKRWLALLALAVAVVWGFRARDAEERGGFLGYVEGELLYIGPVEGERVARLDAETGRNVAAGDPLFSMATPVLDQQRAAAQARLVQMRAQLDDRRAATNRPEQIAVLQAAVDRAGAARWRVSRRGRRLMNCACIAAIIPPARRGATSCRG